LGVVKSSAPIQRLLNVLCKGQKEEYIPRWTGSIFFPPIHPTRFLILDPLNCPCRFFTHSDSLLGHSFIISSATTSSRTYVVQLEGLGLISVFVSKGVAYTKAAVKDTISGDAAPEHNSREEKVHLYFPRCLYGVLHRKY